MKAYCVMAVLLGATATAAAQTVPPAKPVKSQRVLPHRAPRLAIPHQLAPPQEVYASFPGKAETPAPPAPSACQLRLTSLALFRALPVLVGPGECGAVDAVLLQAIVLPDKTKVAVKPPATLRCTMAEQVTQWVRDDVAPLAASDLGAPLRVLDNVDSYECRGRNRVRGATLSEHGRANALDVHDFKLADGRTIGLTDVEVPKDWREAIKASVCARFSTVLGPGSDGEHEEHIHLDLAERHNGYKICEWDVRATLQAKTSTQPSLAASSPAQQTVPLPGDKASDQAAAEKIAPQETVPLPRPRPFAATGLRGRLLRRASGRD